MVRDRDEIAPTSGIFYPDYLGRAIGYCEQAENAIRREQARKSQVPLNESKEKERQENTKSK